MIKENFIFVFKVKYLFGIRNIPKSNKGLFRIAQFFVIFLSTQIFFLIVNFIISIYLEAGKSAKCRNMTTKNQIKSNV